jgi:histidine ammonia-lyase
MLEGSEIIDRYKDYRLQDALSLRCIPQVHGAVKKVLKDAKENVLNEMASVSDNPVVYPQRDDGIALMGGNFDASYVGMSADAMCTAMANLAKMSERRIDRLVNSYVSELPDFLIANPGLNSGYMIPQYTAAALLAEMKVLSHPSTVDNIPTCACQEDVVSLAYGAARKAYQISNKIEHILAIELMTATQALEFHRPLKASPVTGKVCELIRNQVPMLTEDRFLYPDIMTIKRQIHEGEIVKVVEELLGRMDF